VDTIFPINLTIGDLSILHVCQKTISFTWRNKVIVDTSQYSIHSSGFRCVIAKQFGWG